LVALLGEATAVTVVFSRNLPVPENIATLVAGVVTAGMLDVEGRYIVVPGVPARTAPLAAIAPLAGVSLRR
jgi:hypothetical protein